MEKCRPHPLLTPLAERPYLGHCESTSQQQQQVPAGVPQAKHKRRYSLQALRQLDINTDQSGATLN